MTATPPERGYRDLHEHLAALDAAGLLVTVDRPICKDTEMHPLVRWQFRGGIREPDRKARAGRRHHHQHGRVGEYAATASTPAARKSSAAI